MGCQAEVADARIVDEAALHHGPAERALQSAENEDTEELQRDGSGEFSLYEKENIREKKYQADQSAKEAMGVLEPEDPLESCQRHFAEDFLELRGRAVLVEEQIPVRLRERRHDADERLPLGDREARFGQPRQAADHDDGEGQFGADKEPRRHLAAVGL